ncbi:lytic transglycosylase domain-containing protein [Spirosoma sp. KUDC1026]|uniref:lytic transglycosylase domain-containing protein n=1 Tax=Spirosoma sp. KUDC1026 TaxID=2745947 RepID=UPI00159BCA40|nr:lytic transglycosylase domain-containing protein [Spirosoma sp. KUDC1026]QKZ11143.1 LysM peptidoglycan-binding domain-containing protein [Spirosoma sp. KUDC1026]
MKYLNRCLLLAGLLSTTLSLPRLVQAAHVGAAHVGAGPAWQSEQDTTIVKKDTVAMVPTVPDSVLKERLTKLQKTIPLNYHKAVQAYVDYFTFRKASTTKTMLERMPLFFPLYERVLAEYELPDELKYLSIVESALNPRAISHAGAGGLWQIMPGTGRDLKLYQDEYVDERMDPVKATVAACKYLRDLYNIFGDWELAMAAYNCGPGTVKRAMRRSGGDSFYTIYDALPKETRGYVPQFVAFAYMMNHAKDHGIIGENFDAPIPSDTIHVTGYFNLESFAKHSTMPLADLQKMNPAITTTILPESTHRYPLRVPRQQYAYFNSHRRAILDSSNRLPVAMAHILLASVESLPANANDGTAWADLSSNPLARINVTDVPTQATDQLALQAAEEEADEEPTEVVVTRKPSKQTYTVRRGDNLISIADRYHVDLYDLKRWNHLRSNALRQGQKLTILKEVAETTTERLADQGTAKAQKKAEVVAQTKRYKPRYHKVQSGDTLWNIVQRYDGLTIERLKKMNHMRTNQLRPGQKLQVS